MDFLIRRPIAVLMAFTACFIVGMVTYFTLPVSLLPDIAIPEITVQVAVPNTSAGTGEYGGEASATTTDPSGQVEGYGQSDA